MEQVKTLFGFMSCLMVPLILLERIVDRDVILLMASRLAFMLATGALSLLLAYAYQQ